MSQQTQTLGFNLSKDPETDGFDLQAGQSWVYPTNYPIREYQFNITQQALHKNTLVSLPTGLGKTFIAAVVMYNFFRWYPLGKVVFMAPTRPLVKQQVDACYDIMAIPKQATVELTGTKLATSRADIWKDKRVFFITPQILQNDLDTLKELGPKIKCLVFDEAHRARGNHAYCEVIRKLTVRNKYFRVLALSATPGSTIGDVLEVVQNLLISHLEFRTEDSLDVHSYVFKRNLTTVVVPLGEKLQQVRDDYLQILEYYAKTLIKYKIIHGNCGNLTKGKIFMTMKEFQKNRTSSSPNYAEIMKCLNICVTLYHAFELLTRHGLRSFLSFFTEHIDKPLLRGNTRLIEIIDDVREYLGPEPNIDPLPDGSHPDIPKSIKFGHPKFYKLRDILLQHFLEEGDSSRVIVFFEYRNSVTEAYGLLIQARPMLKPRIFLGQGHGVTQRVQINVVKAFREGQCNVLLSTCIGEEGLDVGNVDLIICFDISNKSPIRMVQRMGRTGRKKEGHIIVLVTEGKEQQILKDCLIHKDNIAFHVLSSKELAKGLNSSSPRLIPHDIRPRCEKIHITVKKPALTRNSSIKDMFRNASSSSSEPTFSPDLELIEVPERIPKVEMLWNKKDPLDRNNSTSNIFSKNVEKLRSLQPINQVKHSKSSELLQLVDSKRYNIPSTQIGTSSQLTQNRKMKQGDIRTMFLKASEHEVPQSTKGDYCSGSKELFTEISNYLSIQMSLEDKKCSLCPDDFDCSKYNINIPNIEMSWIQLDDTVFDSITVEDIKRFSKSLDPKPEEIFDLALEDFVDKSLLTLTHRNKEDKIFEKLDLTQLEKMAENIKGNADITLEQMEDAIIEKTNDDLSFVEKSCVFEAPKNLGLLISRYGASIIDETEITETKFPEQTITKRINEEELLGFFHLTSIADLFTNETKIGSSQETIIYSPDMFTDTFAGNKSEKPDFNEGQRSDDDFQLSPVLCKYNRSKTIKKIVSSNIPSGSKVGKTPDKPNLQKLKLPRMRSNDEIDTPSKFTMNATKISSTPCVRKITNGNNDCGVNLKNISVDSVSKAKNETFKSILENSPKKSEINKVDIDIEDICDLSIFGISPIKDKSNVSKSENVSEKVKVASNDLFSTKPLEKKTPAIDFDIDDFCDLASFGITTQKKVDDNEIRKETKLNAVDDKDKSSSQSQWPITQILGYINKSDTQSVSRNSPENTTKPLKDVINKEAVSSQQIGSTRKKSRLCLNTTLEPFKSPPPKSQAKKSLTTLFNTIASDSTNSDDEFEEKSLNPVFKKPRLTQPRINVHNRNSHNSKASSVKCKKEKPKNPFVADEAELSEDENVQVSDDEDDGDQSIYESSFVTDETQHVDTQMHARYLQSIKSPCNRGKFKIPTKPRFNVGNVYSQEVNHADDTYLDDSFVVFDEVEPSQHELSELEILEKKLKEQRKKKRKQSEDDSEPKKRRRIVMPDDDSD